MRGMALDFALMDFSGNVHGNVPIGLVRHGEIFDRMASNYKLLEKMRDYYDDATYETTTELEELKIELTFLAKSHSNNREHSELLKSMIKLVDEAISRHLKIEVVAD